MDCIELVELVTAYLDGSLEGGRAFPSARGKVRALDGDQAVLALHSLNLLAAQQMHGPT